MRGSERRCGRACRRALASGTVVAGALALGGCVGELFGGDGEDPPWVSITLPHPDSEVLNPVAFEFEAGGSVATVVFTWEGKPLQDEPIPVEQGNHTYRFLGVYAQRTVVLTGYDADGAPVAQDEVTFTPISERCAIWDQPGFNRYTIAAINDWTRYPKDGTYPYCWESTGAVCGENWGQIHDGYYATELLFPGGADCFCSGHTLEIFLRAFQLWVADMRLGADSLFECEGNVLGVDSVDIGDFYQHWQGFGVATTASSANAFETAGIGRNLYEEDWDDVLPGDYVNLSRSTGTGHAVIFVDWIEEAGEKVGLRYYGCNGSGASCPDPGDPQNTSGNSGPSYVTEYFEGHGGSVLPQYLFIGRVFLPTSG